MMMQELELDQPITTYNGKCRKVFDQCIDENKIF